MKTKSDWEKEFDKQSRQEMRQLGIENAAEYERYMSDRPLASKVITKDSGKRQEFVTGAKRDTQDGKPRFDLIPLDVLELLQRTYGGSITYIDNTKNLQTDMLPEREVRRDLIPDLMLNRLGGLYHRGAKKYGDNNWQMGIPLTRIYASLFRHLMQWAMGDTSEDHLAAVIWNATALMWTERQVWTGKLPEELADMGAIKEDMEDFK